VVAAPMLRQQPRDPLQFVKLCAIIGVAMAYDETCPVCRTAEIVCGKWTLLVIRDLAEGRSRFCELERSLRGISPRTLSLRLRALEEEGIVERQTFPEVPPRVEYALTAKGKALVPLIESMRSYGRDWLCGAQDAVPAAADMADEREPAIAAA
jgi:DNA-binding HxlR family transcriptional regulator